MQVRELAGRRHESGPGRDGTQTRESPEKRDRSCRQRGFCPSLFRRGGPSPNFRVFEFKLIARFRSNACECFSEPSVARIEDSAKQSCAWYSPSCARAAPSSWERTPFHHKLEFSRRLGRAPHPTENTFGGSDIASVERLLKWCRRTNPERLILRPLPGVVLSKEKNGRSGRI